MENNNNNLKSTFSPGQCSTTKCPKKQPTTTKFLKTNQVPSKPDPKISTTRACTECGKKFLSLKALFGHMRCHPERQWRGINPPPNCRFTEEEYEVANCLLLLANNQVPDPVVFECSSGSYQALGGHSNVAINKISTVEGFCCIREAADVGITRLFKCGVFSTGQGLEGHHKRFHYWDKEAIRVCGSDLINLPAAAVVDNASDDDHQPSLDLRLRL